MDIKANDRVDVYHYKERKWESEYPIEDQTIWFFTGNCDQDFGYICYNIVRDKKYLFPFSSVKKWDYNYVEQRIL